MTNRIPFWVDLSEVPTSSLADFQTAAEEAKADRVYDEQPADASHFIIQNAGDQATVSQADGIVLVECSDWTIIPLENLIAARRNKPGTLFAIARTVKDVQLFRHVLDVGVHGIVLVPNTPDDIRIAATWLQSAGARPSDLHVGPAPLALQTATITAITDAGNAERVCVDCTERFQPGEGLLIGSTANSFILVHAETIKTAYVNDRPFRVNAGAVHSYTMSPGDQTQYLSELQAGSEVLAVSAQGGSRTLTVGRSKIEHRPHTLVRWQSADGVDGSAIVQWAETIRFVNPNGAWIAVTDLQEGDQVLVHTASSARHAGKPVVERMREL